MGNHERLAYSNFSVSLCLSFCSGPNFLKGLEMGRIDVRMEVMIVEVSLSELSWPRISSFIR